MNGAAADLIAVVERRHRHRAHVRVRSPRDRLPLRVRAQVLALEIAQFVLAGEICGLVARTTFQADDLHAGLAELGRQDSSGPADADNHNVRFFDRHGSSPPCLGLQPEDGAARERFPALHLGRREHRLHPGEADSRRAATPKIA